MSHVRDLLAELLMRYGVTHIFGQSGGQTAALYDGIALRSARLTGRPGVCDVTVGPGTTKLSDGLVESRNASVPVVALVGELPRAWRLSRCGHGRSGGAQLREAVDPDPGTHDGYLELYEIWRRVYDAQLTLVEEGLLKPLWPPAGT